MPSYIFSCNKPIHHRRRTFAVNGWSCGDPPTTGAQQLDIGSPLGTEQKTGMQNHPVQLGQFFRSNSLTICFQWWIFWFVNSNSAKGKNRCQMAEISIFKENHKKEFINDGEKVHQNAHKAEEEKKNGET
ncbi:hypothetical protein EGR_08519 [Echinococcus granulosus]|uniref:Uncharacterized protein n=1 Tax=Echinococcus granulosus TaxID=6210 RepID=W6U5Y7_ECHGR|nr:hypothetical protein EGR_08519 [Echinococcus granulosus]EUB56608.1 hypothetical protein EGR_08519 [Echinococcus granulosus]